MNAKWQVSWTRAWDYWRDEWRRWIPVLAASTLWIWIILLAVPQVVPFAFMEFQPINDKVVVQTYHRQVTALIHHMPELLIVGAVITVLGLVVVPRLFPTKRGATSTVLWSGMGLVLSYAGMAAMRVPISGPDHPPALVAIRALVVAGLFIVVVPWTMWKSALGIHGGERFWHLLRTQWRETLFLPWTWLAVLVMVQMLAASFAWTTTVNAVGSFVVALLTVVAGMVCMSVAYLYSQPQPGPAQLQKSS
ncbi:hypothetical protein [Sulfobacillus harzensis]|uniref:Uncharacterized protein n=1 Tax=Sulfobacillus harzensis TaxID=2729629 RepID=A0A7Y0Q0C4_9FIRM|nr:hypothetical protein [Sulfobacillus harzensis]NMP20853.1 hypothetical protein [Sulfobacillus harzensis]